MDCLREPGAQHRSDFARISLGTQGHQPNEEEQSEETASGRESNRARGKTAAVPMKLALYVALLWAVWHMPDHFAGEG
jgi:hypothetical protein